MTRWTERICANSGLFWTPAFLLLSLRFCLRLGRGHWVSHEPMVNIIALSWPELNAGGLGDPLGGGLAACALLPPECSRVCFPELIFLCDAFATVTNRWELRTGLHAMRCEFPFRECKSHPCFWIRYTKKNWCTLFHLHQEAGAAVCNDTDEPEGGAREPAQGLDVLNTLAEDQSSLREHTAYKYL